MIIHTESVSIDTNKAGLSFRIRNDGTVIGCDDGSKIYSNPDPKLVGVVWTAFQKLLIDYKTIDRNFEIEEDGSFTDLGMCGHDI